MKPVIYLFVCLAFVLLPLLLYSQKKQEHIQKKLIILSIDGFPGYYATDKSEIMKLMPNFKKILSKSNFSNTVRTVLPSVTYPAHTSMVTGVDPIQHKIFSNIPIDPLNKIQPNAWFWFAEDQKVKSIWDFAKEEGLSTASIYWPVTVGADIDYNVPQYWRFKNQHDAKILRWLSTEGLYDELQKDTNMILTEDGGDTEKMEYAISVWKKKEPDLMLIYTTDLDTAHHQYGVYSKQAKEKIKTIDHLLGKLLKETNLYHRNDLALIIISDHGFEEYNSMCYPNAILYQMGVLKNNYWEYYFLSAGGSAHLYKNKFVRSRLKLKRLSKWIAKHCPGSILDYSGNVYKRAKAKLSKEVQAVLYSTEKTVYLKTYNGTIFRRLNSSGYNHGFLPSNKDMFTIGLFYPRTDSIQFRSVKDVLKYSCEWLDIECRAGEEKL
jgi:predicted AlkP superfamily pyrophosphatase or phosphodiesterase